MVQIRSTHDSFAACDLVLFETGPSVIVQKPTLTFFNQYLILILKWLYHFSWILRHRIVLITSNLNRYLCWLRTLVLTMHSREFMELKLTSQNIMLLISIIFVFALLQHCFDYNLIDFGFQYKVYNSLTLNKYCIPWKTWTPRTFRIKVSYNSRRSINRLLKVIVCQYFEVSLQKCNINPKARYGSLVRVL